MAPRSILSRSRIVDAAAAVADRGGLGAVSMRHVAAELGVEAMSLYHHIANKEALLDALSEWVFVQIAAPDVEDEWRDAMVARARSARGILAQHPWALGLLDSRPTPGSALLRHHDRVLGCLMRSGFSTELATHAFSAIDAYVYGFVLTESNLPFTPGDGAEGEFATTVAAPADEYPYIARAVEELTGKPGYAFADEFDYGLDLILESLARRLVGSRG